MYHSNALLICPFIFRDIQALTELTNLFKFENMTLLLEKQSWVEQFPRPRRNSKNSKRFNELKQESGTKKNTILSTQKTRSGRLVVHKKFIDEELIEDVEEDPIKVEDITSNLQNFCPSTSNVSFQNVQTETPEPAEEIQEFHVVTTSIQAKEQGIKYFMPTISKDKPDTHEINSAVELEGTDTKLLIRTCFLCQKQLLGRNALGKYRLNNFNHLKGVFPTYLLNYVCKAVPDSLFRLFFK